MHPYTLRSSSSSPPTLWVIRRVDGPELSISYRNNQFPIILRGRFTSPLPLSTGPVPKSIKVCKVCSPLKKCCSRSSQSYIYDFFFWTDCHVLACKFRTMPFFIRGVAKMEGGKNCILSFFDFLAICLDVPQKRLAKSSYKTNIILTFSLQRPSHAPTCVSRCCLPFL